MCLNLFQIYDLLQGARSRKGDFSKMQVLWLLRKNMYLDEQMVFKDHAAVNGTTLQSHTYTQTDTQTYRHTHRHTDTQIDIQTDTDIHRQTHRHTQTHRGIQTHTQNRHTDAYTETDIQTDRHTLRLHLHRSGFLCSTHLNLHGQSEL